MIIIQVKDDVALILGDGSAGSKNYHVSFEQRAFHISQLAGYGFEKKRVTTDSPCC